MNEEYFDVVDEQDRPVRRALRGEAHARGWRHRAGHLFACNARGEIFCKSGRSGKTCRRRGGAVSCSGHVDAGEDCDAAARRELGEELGWRVAEAPPKWRRAEPCLATGWEFSWIHRLEAEGPFELNEDEIEGGAWLAPAEIAPRAGRRVEEHCPGFRWIGARSRRA